MGISPSVVRYGDIVTIQGNLNSAKNRSQFVMLNIDNQGITGTRINFKGDYEFHYSIRKITSGQHTVYISSGGIFSDPGSFTVIPVNSMTSLSVPLSSDQPWVNITGRLYTSEGVQVLDAPVIITRDRTNTIEVTTGDEGQYFTSIDLPNGNHTLQAIFQGTGYPVNPSKSQVSKINVQYQVPVKPKAFPWFSIAVLGGALVISSGAAVFYLRRQRTLSLIRPARHETLPEDITLTELPHEVLTPENTRQEAGEIQQGQGQGELELSIKEKGFRETAYNIYWEIITLLDNKIPLSAVRSWTTREIAASCQGKSYYQFIRNFIAIYERVRYGPEPLKEEDKARFLEESRDLIAIIRGDKHP